MNEECDNGATDYLFDPDLRWDVDHDQDFTDETPTPTRPFYHFRTSNINIGDYK